MHITCNEDTDNVNATVNARKSRFLRALAKAGLSQAAWAREQDITPAHLSFVLNGKRDSEVLTCKIDAFVRESRKAVKQVA